MTLSKSSKRFIGLFSLLVLAFVLSLSIGYTKSSLGDVIAVFVGQASPATRLIITSIRLPRILACLLGGASLALSGLLLQTLTRNPLADSGILGINTGAGMVIALAISTVSLEDPAIIRILPIFAVLGGGLTIFLVYLLSVEKGRGIRPVRLIMTGIGVSTMLSGLMVSIVGNIDRYKMDYIVTWLSGRISGDDWTTLQLISPFLMLFWGLAYARSRHFNLFLLPEESTIALGSHIQKERLALLVLSTCLTALSVLLVGNITFVGLVAGHISRRLWGSDHRLSIPASMMIGMLILLIADTIGRVLLVGTGIPTGLVVSMVGAPYFLLIINKKS